MIRADCHFHPNFPFFLPEFFVRRHARKLWKTFQKRKLDTVFVAEHAFKLPLRSYRTLLRERPEKARTVLIPAVEALSKEGIDMIVFSRDQYVYTQKDIITPYRLTIGQLVTRVRQDRRLYGVIPHPFAPSDSGILRHESERDARREERTLHFVEKYNASLAALEQFLSAMHLTRLLRRLSLQAKNTTRLPVRMIPRGMIFLGGSDAHHVWDMGSCLLIHAPKPRDERRMFRALISPKHKRTFFWRRHRHPLYSMVSDGVTAFREHLMRKLKLFHVERALPRIPAHP